MKVSRAVSTIALAISISSAAWGQEAQSSDDGATASGLSEIIVTATKRSENLQNVPVAVSAISAEMLQNKGVFETSDLNNTMPNFQVSSPYGQQQPNFSVRGVGVGTEFNANAASPVGVYVDEVYQAFRSSHGQQLYDLEQIEVVRGPQGTLYGRNTTGGAINFITRGPKLRGQEGYFTAGYGRFNRLNLEGAVEVTPVPDKFGIRIAATYVDADPYLKNVLSAGLNTSAGFGLSGLNRNSGKSPGGTKSYGLRGTFRWQAADTVDLKLKVYAAEAEGGTEAPIPTGSSKTSDVINFTNPNFLLGGLFAALAPAGLVPSSYSREGRLGERQVEYDTIGDALSRARGAVFDARIDLSDSLKLISITGYDDGVYRQKPTTDCDGTPLRLCAIGYASKFHAFNQDLRFDYDGGPFKAIVGAYYGRDNIKAFNEPDFFNLLSDVRTAVGLPASFFNPGGAFNGTALSAVSLPTGIRASQRFTQVRTSYAGYAEGSYEITPTIKLTLGGRYTKDRNVFKDGITTYFDDAGTARLITVSNFQQGGAFAPYFLQPVRDEAGNVVIPSFQALGIPLPGGLRRKGTSGRFSGRAIIDWKASDDILLYGSYSRGYRSGTFNGLAYGSANQVYFVKPEEVDAFEVGFKSRFLDNRLQFNVAAFYYDYKGQQGQVVDASATANLISLDGTLKGIEADLQFEPIDSLLLTASFGLLDSSYDDGDCPANPATIPNFPAQLGSCVVSSGGPVTVAGNPFPYAAKTSASVGFDWSPIDTGSNKLTLHGDANYTGRFYYDSFRDYSRGPLPRVASGEFGNGEGDYWILNARATYTFDRYTLAVWGKNLTDKTIYPFGISLENLFGNGYRVRAQPLTYGVEATVRF
ncbi:MAG: TonB-dependent receptor [Novosphingobium sp.]|nr:TonB-dependent receptor [Novosphingobium sp.]